MKLQNFLLPSNDFQHKEMYIRGGKIKKDLIFIDKGTCLSFDTYYNCISYPVFSRYTNVKNIDISFCFKGKAKVKLCLYRSTEETLCEKDVSSDDFTSYSIEYDITNLPDMGIMYLKFIAESDCVFKSGEISSVCDFCDINCAIVICTYKRENYVLDNIEFLKSHKYQFINKVFVIDNGSTLDVGKISNAYISVLPNKNYGGSGGFTRGLIEAYDNGYTHVIFMDDDIEFSHEMLERMTAILAALKSENRTAWFGTAMLPKTKRNIQFELGADWNGKQVKQRNANLNLCEKDNLVLNTVDDHIGYTGWWCMSMPTSIVQEQGLPYPFFIKFDDTEYGLRRNSKTPIITTNGISVIHDDFSAKATIHLQYYEIRNRLVTNAVTKHYSSLKNAVLILWHSCIKQLFMYRYECADIIFKAYNDFFKGVDFFLATDEEELNRRLIASVPKSNPLSDIKNWNNKDRCSSDCDDRFFLNANTKRVTKKQILTLANHLIPIFILEKKPIQLPFVSTRLVECYRRKTMIQYQLGADKGFVFERNVCKFFIRIIKMIWMTAKLFVLFPITCKKYKQKADILTSVDFWKKHLNI